MFNRELLEQQLAELPLFQYFFVNPDELLFTERVRYVCQAECPRYGKTWACPPAVGSVEECRGRCGTYENLLVISTVTEVEDGSNMEQTLATRGDHETVTHQVDLLLRAQGLKPLVLSTESCAICDNCTYPNGPCRHPDRMYPCVESYGILVTDLMEKHGMEFYNGNIVTWFSLLFY